MSQRLWIESMNEERQAEAKAVLEPLEKIGWDNLSPHDRRMMDAVGYLCLERDDVELASLLDADIGDQETE